MKFETVGVVGAGVMGVGLAQNLSQTGHRVVLVDIADEVLQRAQSEIRKNIRMQILFKKMPEGETLDSVLDRIQFTTDPADLAPSDFVIENVTEKWSIKQEVYKQIDSVCRESVVFAANTSGGLPFGRVCSDQSQV